MGGVGLLFYDTSLGGFHEIYDVLYFFRDFQRALYLSYALLTYALGIEQPIGFVDEFYELIGETMTAKANDVHARISYGFLAGNDVGRDILRETAAALYHHVAAHTAELVGEHFGGDYGIVGYFHFTAELCRVADDEVGTEHTVVCHMHILHEQVVAAHLCGTLGSRAPGDGYVLTNGIVVANLAQRILALELQVLGFGGYACAGEDLVAVAQACAVVDGYAVLEDIVRANDCISVDIAERANDIIVAEFGFRMYKCQRTYIIHCCV